jgi:DNA-binding response OmpR family regulator
MSQILVVLLSQDRLQALASLLKRRGHDVISAGSFEEAGQALSEDAPDLLITEIRLGAYNGLHLVIRSSVHHPHMKAILLGRVCDPLLEQEARSLGATYLVDPRDPNELLATVLRKLEEPAVQRRWYRKQPAGGLPARVAHRLARVVDLSYGGLRFEVSEDPGDELSSPVDVAMPAFDLTIRAQPVWTHPAPSGLLWCGAALAEANPDTIDAWRRVVDAVPNALA